MLTAAVVTAAMAIAVTLVGCTPEPEPTPAPSGFADEDAAFAAAEATYRAYVDALNRVDLSDPETFEDVYRWTTGDALAAIKKSLSTMHAKGWRVTGNSRAALVRPLQSRSSFRESTLAVCLDVSGVSVVNDVGESVVSDDRGSVQSMTVRVVPNGTSALIRSIEAREGEPSC